MRGGANNGAAEVPPPSPPDPCLGRVGAAEGHCPAKAPDEAPATPVLGTSRWKVDSVSADMEDGQGGIPIEKPLVQNACCMMRWCMPVE